MADRNIWTSATPVIGPGNARKGHMIGGVFSLVTGDLALNKTVSLFKAPKGFTVTNVKAYATDMDTGGSPALVFSVGDADTAARIISVSTSAQAGGEPTIALSTILGYQFAAETEIVFKCTTAAATAAAGTLTIFMSGYFD